MDKLIITKCAICDTDASDEPIYPANFELESLTYEVFSARRLPDRLHYRIVRCKNCRLVRSNPILNAEDLAKLYQGSYFTYEDKTDYAARTYARYLERALKHLKGDIHLLEIGCGNGFFLKKAQALGISKIFGIEPSADAVYKSGELKSRIHVGMFRAGIFPKEQFDLICAFQVFDHISQPNEFLNTCRQYLKKDGMMLLINHDVSSVFAKILGENCPMIDIEHTFLYDKKTMTKILEKNNFKVCDVFDVANTYPLSYWLQLLPSPKSLKMTLLNSIKNSRIGNFPLTLQVGNLGVIAKIEEA